MSDPAQPHRDQAHRDEAPNRVRIRAVWVVTAAIVATWIAALATGIDVRAPSPAELIALGGNWAPRTRGEPWRLVSAAFVHAGGLHLTLNVIGLLVLGTLVERRLAALATTVVMLGATVVASAASLATSPYSVSVGASGAIAGLAGALVVALLRESRQSVAQSVSAPPPARSIAIVAVVVFLAWGSILAATTDAVDHAAHVGGLVTGAAIAWIAASRAGAARRGRTLGAGALAITATAAIVALARPPVDVRAIGADVVAIEGRYDRIIEGVGFRADGPRLAATLEREVLGPLRDVTARLIVDERLPPRDHRFAKALARYLAARLRALELHNHYLETGDASVLDAIDAADADARAAGASLD